jgi:hypothetical protein
VKIGSRGCVCYPSRSLTLMSSADRPNTSASANPASAPCRTGALDQLVWPSAFCALPIDQGFSGPYDTSYRGLKLPWVSAAFGRSYLRYEADLPQVAQLSGGLPAGDQTRLDRSRWNRRAARANRAPGCPRRIEQPSRQDRARLDAVRLCTRRLSRSVLRRQRLRGEKNSRTLPSTW